MTETEYKQLSEPVLPLRGAHENDKDYGERIRFYESQSQACQDQKNRLLSAERENLLRTLEEIFYKKI